MVALCEHAADERHGLSANNGSPLEGSDSGQGTGVIATGYVFAREEHRHCQVLFQPYSHCLCIGHRGSGVEGGGRRPPSLQPAAAVYFRDTEDHPGGSLASGAGPEGKGP